MKKILLITIFFAILNADEKNELIIDIEQSLMATCCWTGTVYDHGNKEMEIEIASMVNNGKSKPEILSYFTDKYGERVLSTPVVEGFNIFAWLAPFFMSLMGLGIIITYMKTGKKEISTIKNYSNKKIKYNDDIERELKEFD
jgi:cytochrome c-type biogenesis protein CcmH/NrfF